ncbi:hypothetical protein SELMODRAFT_403629 [Selaginella moellendorffii]|uniref:Uncharacterized protein n=1 Tax=Selaginella moellendorffii TaxID=88036 RepID=D8QS11_SELML|nr:hypothetical protein SELMODRAFT_403629 [Selaginella moellendorffii]
MASEENAENAVQTATKTIFLLGAVPRPVAIRRAGTAEIDRLSSSSGSPSKTLPRIIDSYSREAENLSKLRNLHYQHFIEETLLDRLQMEDANALHEEQMTRLVDTLDTSDFLSSFQLQQEMEGYRRLFPKFFQQKNPKEISSPERFELSRAEPMYLAGTRLNHSAKAT